MDRQFEFLPRGLSSQQLEQLLGYQDEAEKFPTQQLADLSAAHVERARHAYSENGLVNVRLAEAINAVIQKILQSFDTLIGHARSPFRGAIYYFISEDDTEPDFASPIGLEDDVDVLNACLDLARRSDLPINAEDYDDA